MKRVDCKKYSELVKKSCRAAIAEYKLNPRLAVISVGNDPASEVYIRGKKKDCTECGIDFKHIKLPTTCEYSYLVSIIHALNHNDSIHGIIVQLPLPKHLNPEAIIEHIDDRKDVDGFGRSALHKLEYPECPKGFFPCTPLGCMRIISEVLQQDNFSGLHAVVVGRSQIVGRPLAKMLLNQNATVTVCHSHTKDIAELTKQADILISATGKAGLITADMIKPGAVVIDVGINRGADGKLCGDVDFESVNEIAGYVTPVPGGIGLMTRAMLVSNVVIATLAQSKNERPFIAPHGALA